MLSKQSPLTINESPNRPNGTSSSLTPAILLVIKTKVLETFEYMCLRGGREGEIDGIGRRAKFMLAFYSYKHNHQTAHMMNGTMCSMNGGRMKHVQIRQKLVWVIKQVGEGRVRVDKELSKSSKNSKNALLIRFTRHKVKTARRS